MREAVKMMTVNEVSKLTGVSARTLQYYDKIELLHPARYTDAGYRLYDNAALETLQQILLFRELEFPLKDIREIIGSPDFDRSKALEQQIELLKLKKEHIENLIDLAIGIKAMGVKQLTFDAFDTRKIDEYAAQAKASWGTTLAYKEYEEKSKGRTKEDNLKIHQGMIDIFGEFGQIRNTDPASEEAQAMVRSCRIILQSICIPARRRSSAVLE
jgi:DNA-binding transcriptional MerR regulator